MPATNVIPLRPAQTGPVALGPAFLFVVGDATTRELSEALTEFGVQGATVSGGIGLWQGRCEISSQALVAGLSQDHVLDIAAKLRDRFAQQCVLVMPVATDCWLV